MLEIVLIRKKITADEFKIFQSDMQSNVEIFLAKITAIDAVYLS